MTRLHSAFVALALLFGPVLSGCSGLAVYNDLASQGDDGEVVVEDVAYGPEARQKLDVYVPAGAPRNAPVIVFFYGGKWSSGRKEDYSFVGEAFARRGFVTLVADYRLVPDVRYPAFVQDTAKAIAFAYHKASSYGGNPSRLYISGHSAGAYNAMMVAIAPEFLQAEGLSPGVIKGVAAISGPYDFSPLDTDLTTAAFAGTKDARSMRPIDRVGDGATPRILLLAGGSDTLVRPRHAKAMEAALHGKGKSVRTIMYPGVGHAGTVLAIGQPLQKRTPVVDDIVNFFGGGVSPAS